MWAKNCRETNSEIKLGHHHLELCFLLELPSIGTQARLIKTTTWQPKRTTTITPAPPTSPRTPRSKSCFIKVPSNSFQVVAKLRRVSQRETTKTNILCALVRCAPQRRSLRCPWEVKSLRCSCGLGVWWGAAEFGGLWALGCRAQWNMSITGVLHWSHKAFEPLKGTTNGSLRLEILHFWYSLPFFPSLVTWPARGTDVTIPGFAQV